MQERVGAVGFERQGWGGEGKRERRRRRRRRRRRGATSVREPRPEREQ